MATRDIEKKRKKSRPAAAEHWKTDPDEHDYPAAADYLSLLLGDADVDRLVDELKSSQISHRKAKDLLRASRLPLLGTDSFHVAEDLKKVRLGERLSPVLLVRGDLSADAPLTVADGYHRICASYHLDENADIPCRLVERRQMSGTPSAGVEARSAAALPGSSP
jgi:hypothetical protein